MPQMSPMPWLLLFISLTFTMIMFMCVNFFTTNTTPQQSSIKTLSTKSMNWKW